MPNWIENSNRCTGPTAEDSEEARAFHAGYDCGKNGPNAKNCNFSLFRTPAMTAAWERGKTLAGSSQE